MRWRPNCIRRRPRLNPEIRPPATFFSAGVLFSPVLQIEAAGRMVREHRLDIPFTMPLDGAEKLCGKSVLGRDLRVRPTSIGERSGIVRRHSRASRLTPQDAKRVTIPDHRSKRRRARHLKVGGVSDDLSRKDQRWAKRRANNTSLAFRGHVSQISTPPTS